MCDTIITYYIYMYYYYYAKPWEEICLMRKTIKDPLAIE